MKMIYSPETIVYGEEVELPYYIYMMGEKLFYDGEIYDVDKYGIGIRKGGPDAYAGFIVVPKGAWCRRVSDDGKIVSAWVKTVKKQRIYIETIGEGIEYLKITADNKIEWEMGIGYEL